MAHVYADRVKEVFTSTGPGNITLGGAADGGFTTFASAIGVGNTTEVCARDPATGEWEVFATQLLSATVLNRGTVLASSTGGRISFVGGTKEVFVCLPAAETMRRTEIEAELVALDALIAAKIGDAPNDGVAYARQGLAWSAMPRRPAFVTVSGATHTPAVGPDGQWFLCTNAGGCAVTIPTDAAQPHPLGTMLTYEQDGAGAVTFVGDTGVTVRPAPASLAETAGQGAVVQLVKRTATFWTLYGALGVA